MASELEREAIESVLAGRDTLVVMSTGSGKSAIYQIAGLLIALLPQVEPPVSDTVAALSLAALAYSFAVDTMWLWHRRNLRV